MNTEQTETKQEAYSGQNPLGFAPIPQLMRKFAIPSIVAMMVAAVYNIVDQLFIGQYVGTLGNAATNVAFPFSISCTALGLVFGIGGASSFNIAMGRREPELASHYVGNAIVMLFGSGVVLFLLTQLFMKPLLVLFGAPQDVLPYATTYMRITSWGFPFLLITTGGGHLIRADGSPKMTMFCSLSGAVLNTGLDALFMIVFHMGMRGAALATIIGQIFSGVITIWYLAHYKTVKIGVYQMALKLCYLKRIMSLGMASFFNQLAMMLVQIVLNNLLTHYGGLSEYGRSVPLACAGIAMKVNQLYFSIVIGIAQGTQPIESFNYGAQQYSRVKGAYKLAIKAGAVVAVVFFLLFQLFPRQILAMFGDGGEAYIKLGTEFFRTFLFFTFLNFLQPITATFFTSIGKAYKGMFLSLTRQILFLLPLLLLFAILWGIQGILYAAPVADFMAAVTALLMVKKEFTIMGKEEVAA